MDPAFITAAYWDRIADFVHLLWILPLSVLGFAGNLLLSRAVIPSLIFTGRLSVSRGRLLQRGMYLVAALFFALVVLVLFTLVGWSDVIKDVYPRWWI